MLTNTLLTAMLAAASAWPAPAPKAGQPEEASPAPTAAEPTTETPAEPETETPAEATTETTTTTPTKRSQRPDVLGIVLVSVGAVPAVVGLGVYGAARGDLNKPPLGGTEGEHFERDRELTRRAKIGIGFASVGGAIVVAGVVHLIVHARKRKAATSSSPPPVQASASGSGFVLRF